MPDPPPVMAATCFASNPAIDASWRLAMLQLEPFAISSRESVTDGGCHAASDLET
jgi:hypothetical protein